MFWTRSRRPVPYSVAELRRQEVDEEGHSDLAQYIVMNQLVSSVNHGIGVIPTVRDHGWCVRSG